MPRRFTVNSRALLHLHQHQCHRRTRSQPTTRPAAQRVPNPRHSRATQSPSCIDRRRPPSPPAERAVHKEPEPSQADCPLWKAPPRSRAHGNIAPADKTPAPVVFSRPSLGSSYKVAFHSASAAAPSAKERGVSARCARIAIFLASWPALPATIGSLHFQP